MKTTIRKQYLKLTSMALAMLCTGITVHAQEQTQAQAPLLLPPQAATADHSNVEANNPLASVKSVNANIYYMSSLYGVEDATMTQSLVRYAQPIGQILFRATFPVATMSLPSQSPESGIGDLSMFAIYKFKMKNKGMELGVGPTVAFPTGDDTFGSGKWQAGLSAIAFFKSNPVVQVGTLLTWQTSFAGDDDRADVNMLTPQVFFTWQLGAGTYLRSTGVWSFNLNTGDYNVPIGLGVGKVIKTKGLTFNVFMEPQYSILAEGMGQPKLQFLLGFNTQFR